MSVTNLVWKIRDNTTGLFWNGSAGECCHPIGTRFVKESAMWGTVTWITNKKGRFPETWEVVHAELSETELKVFSPQDVHISSMLDRVCGDLFVPYMVAGLLRNLRRDGTLQSTNFLGMRKNRKQTTKAEFAQFMSDYGVAKKRFTVLAEGLVLFADKTAATMPMLGGKMDFIYDVLELRKKIAKALDVDVSDV